ncbi:MAG: hypothetical protein MUE69_10645 [Myxococcota bacterium]|jgi:hypothetical protein|nr:hypothetical protein [Myxococcota bacterium]
MRTRTIGLGAFRHRRARWAWVAITGVLFAMGCPSDPPSVVAPCPDGSDACPCSVIGECPEGRVCRNHACLVAEVSELRLRARDARSCELLLTDDEGYLAEVEPNDGVLAQSARRGSRTGVAFIAEGDVALAGAPLRLRWLDAPPVPESVVCFDRTGAELADARVEVR